MRLLTYVAIACSSLFWGILTERALATSCDAQEYYDHIVYSDWVLLGTVVDAQFVDERRSSIHFVMDEVEAIRGEPPPRIELNTNIGAYNPKITIGEQYIAYVNSADRYVSYCRSFKKYDPEEYFGILLMRKKGDCGTRHDREIAAMFLLKEYSDRDRPLSKPDLEKLLRQFVQIAPSLEYDISEDRITVKGIEFVFEEDQLSAVNYGECAA